MYNDKYFMDIALSLAKKAFNENEIPVGALIVINNEIIAQAYNQKDASRLVTKHAELIAIEQASNKVGDWRLNDATIYVTMEPCPMCASAIQQSRIRRLVYGCSSNITDNTEIICHILQNNNYNHQVLVSKGILDDECSSIVKEFFRSRR